MSDLAQHIAELQATNNRLQEEIQTLKAEVAALRPFRMLVEHAPQGVTIASLDQRVLFANQSYAQMLGYADIASVQGIDVTTTHRSTPEQLAEIERQLRSANSYHGFIELCHRDGSTSSGHTSVFVLPDESGQPAHFVAITSDITAQHAQSQRLNVLERIVEHSPDGISFSDDTGHTLYANPSLHEMLGYGEELIGMPYTQYIDIDHLEEISAELNTRGVVHIRLTYHRKDGSSFPAQQTTFKLPASNNQPELNVSLVRDITQLQHAEAERQEMQSRIIQAQQAALRELSTPLIPLADGVIALPLIGTIDSGRAQQILEVLLEGIGSYQAATAILDVTGVKVMDTQVANALIRAAQAAKLLGARVILSGISPEVAQTLVHLGVDLSNIVTHRDLQRSIAVALHDLGKQ